MESLAWLRRKGRRSVVRTRTASILARTRRRVGGERSVLVLLPNEAFHYSFYLVGVDGYCWLGIARIVGVVGIDIANALHVLGFISLHNGRVSAQDPSPRLGRCSSYPYSGT